MPTNVGTALEFDRTPEVMSRVYLLLWKRIDVFLGETKWLAMRPEAPDQLFLESDAALRDLRPLIIKNIEVWERVQEDRDRVTKALRSDARNRPEIEALKDYLRDKALEYASQSQQLK